MFVIENERQDKHEYKTLAQTKSSA
jgi:hypothetical protein